MSAIGEAIKKSAVDNLEIAEVPVSSVARWNWLPNLLMFLLLSIVLWNYLSEREYRRQMEVRLDTTMSDLESTRNDLQRVERQSHEVEDLLHAELEASNGRMAKMKFDLESIRTDRDAADAALAASQKHVEILQSQNERLHEVIQSIRRHTKSSPAATGSVAWDSSAASSS